jgi:negative regulator of sigma E activity
MEDSKLTDKYNANITGSETIDERHCWVVELTANTPDIAYYKRKLWIDKDRFIPLKEELFAKSGTLLKRIEMKDVVRMENRWYPKTIIFKDVLKSGEGTEFITENIKFDQKIPDYIFSKASLKR